MARETTRKSKALADYPYTNEIVAVVLLALAALIFLCLVTYSPDDSSFNTSSSQKTSNLIGFLGARIADVILQFIGLASYIVPALLAFSAWQIFRSDGFKTPINRIIGFILFIASLSGLFVVLGISPFFDGAIQPGGIMGKFVGMLASPLGGIGSFILLFALAIIGFLLLTNWSLRFVFDQSLSIFYGIAGGFGSIFGGLIEWRQAESEKAKERMEKRNALREAMSAGQEKESDPIGTGKESKKPEPEKPAKTWKDKLNNLVEKLAEPPEPLAEGPAGPDEQPHPKITTAKPIEEPLAKTKESAESRFIDEPDLAFIGKPATAGDDNEYRVDGGIPITPVQTTGDLNEPAGRDAPEAPKRPSQDFAGYKLPPSDFIMAAPPRVEQKDEELLAIAQELTDKFKEFNATGRVMHICQGPVVTTYEYKPDAGVKFSKITSLSDDLCLALKAESIRIDRIPGKAFVGIEVPNHNRETIFLREVVESKKFKESQSLLTIALGKTIDGLNFVSDLAKMPHLLIAGATGAGKSVGVNTLVVSILYKARPDEVKFIMVDPKRLELGVYADIPHLLTPIITDPKRASISLKWAVSEMERRYKELAGWGVRNIDGYNAQIKRKNSLKEFDEDGEPWKALPYIVIIIDELADLMMVSGKEVEESITRLAQMARAVGIHLVLATQRPSVDVITGLIKANFPARISFRVSSKIDSRTIIDANGSEKLLGRGDMLFLPPATSQIVRVHGAFVDEKEIHQIVDHIKKQGNPDYDTNVTKTEEEIEGADGLPGKTDPLFTEALRTVVGAKRASTSLLQRHLRIGYGRAAAILDAMVREGYIGEMDGGTRARPILQAAYEALERAESGGDF